MAATVGVLAAAAMAPAVAGSVPAPAVAAGGCTATAHVDSQWGSGTGGGEVITISVGNTAAAAATTWSVNWTPGTGQRLVSAWNATANTAGGTVTFTNERWNGALPAGASTTFGMQLSGTGPAPQMSCANDAAPVSRSPSAGTDVTVTAADNQTTVTLAPGQTLRVSLSTDYTSPTVTGSGLTAVSSSGGYPTGQPLAAVYHATAPGTADLTSRTDYACLHASPPCTVPIAQWTVHVVIAGATPSNTIGGTIPVARTVTVTTADTGTSVSLNVGDTLVVSLPALYQPPTVTGSALTLVSSSGGYPTGQPLVAQYHASTTGSLDVSSLTDAACLHQAMPCPSPQVPWTVHVYIVLP